MNLQEAIEKQLLTIKEEEGTKWLIETATGEKVISLSDNDNATISINAKGIVTAVFL